MFALRAIPVPDMAAEVRMREIDPNQSAIVGANADITAVRILPSPVAQTEHLAIIQFATEPGGLSATHHHGELDTAVYVIRGTIGFKCGAGMHDYVAMREGELGFIEPLAVHAENNPEPANWSLGLSIRDRPNPSYFPCEAPTEVPHGRTGLEVVSRPAVTAQVSPAESDRALGALSTHHLRTRHMALDRIALAPGAKYAAPFATSGETALSALAGAVRVSDTGTARSLQGKGGDWWYLEDGTQWAVENTSPSTPAEVLVVRSAA